MEKRKAISKKTRFEVFKRDNFTCQYCGRMAPNVILEIDHINPVANNGNNNVMNLITSCFDCNRGKGKRKLTDKEEIKKQQEQLLKISEQKEQLEMMIKWKEELSNFENEQADKIAELFLITDWCVSDFGKEKIKKWIKKFGFEEVYDSTKISLAQYWIEEDEDSWHKTFDYIPKICSVRVKQKNDPKLYQKNYLIKIAENRFSYVNRNILNNYFDKLLNNDDNFEYLKQLACEAKNWTVFKCWCEELIDELIEEEK